VLIADRTYTGPGNEDIDFGGRNITVTSQHGAAGTIINGAASAPGSGSTQHRGFYMHTGRLRPGSWSSSRLAPNLFVAYE
jgi:hypothetical protein